jgi:hypothetical protein
VHYSSGAQPRWEWAIDKNRNGLSSKIEKIAGKSVTEIIAWFQRFKCIRDIVAAMGQEKVQSGDISFYCYPDMVLAYSFALARIGKSDEAGAEFERLLQSKLYHDETVPKLRQLLEAEIEGGRPGASGRD